MRRGTEAGVGGGKALGRCPPGGLSYRSLDVHCCCRHPELDLDPCCSSKACAPQSVELLGEAEGAFDADLALPEPSLPERAGRAFRGRLDQVLHELAMERP